MPSSDSKAKLDRVVAAAHEARNQREQGYRARALKLYPWVCARCGRSFDRQTLAGLTVHHRDHDHDNNPPDGSNWELLCLYCHDNEHARRTDAGYGQLEGGKRESESTYRPFADLADKLKQEK